MERFTGWLKATYDKLMAVVILAVLIVSLLYLAIKIGVDQSKQKQWEQQIMNLTPANPEAESVTSDKYDKVMVRLETPGSIEHGTWVRRLIVPEERFWCEDCKFPNPMDQEICVSCKQPLDDGVIPDDWDEDGAGIPNVKELEWGMDPTDPDDEDKDKDGDGFTNLMEYRSGSNPTNSASTPPIETWISVVDVQAEAFNLLFKGCSTLADGSRAFQLNTRANNTKFVQMSNTVDNFTVVDFKTNFVQQVRPIRMIVDRSQLFLRSGNRIITLTKGKKVQLDKLNATLKYERTGKEYIVHKDDVVELQGNKYTVNSIDTQSRTVVITRVSDSKKFVIDNKGGTAVDAKEKLKTPALPGGAKSEVTKPAKGAPKVGPPVEEAKPKEQKPGAKLPAGLLPTVPSPKEDAPKAEAPKAALPGGGLPKGILSPGTTAGSSVK